MIPARFTIPGTRDVVVLAGWMDAPTEAVANLSRRRADGTLVWQAEPPVPATADAWVSAQVNRAVVRACSWSGYEVDLDVATGEALVVRFTR